MRPPCKVPECQRQNAAKGLCLLHYKRFRKYGTTDYRWGGKVVGRPCRLCKRPVESNELCGRHYQMLKLHGDPLWAEKRRKSDSPVGTHISGGYICTKKNGKRTPLHRAMTNAKPGQPVHHVDGDKRHNVGSNFFVCRDASQHRRIHLSLETAAFELVKQGVILFDRQQARYVLQSIEPH